MLNLAENDKIRPSSTVVVVRAGKNDPEIFMVRRHPQSSFSSAYAFPGGVVDPADTEVHEYCADITSAEANARLGVEDNGLDYYSAAIRELFEETGILLADLSSLDEDIASVRDALNEGSQDWADFVRRKQLSLHCGELHYFNHWITPSTEPKRYTTRFFLTTLPDDQNGEHCGGELTESCWITATDMLAAERRGDVKLIYPTVKSLESIARYRSLEELVEWARSCVEWGLTTMQPVIIERNGKREVVLPGDIDYPSARS